jgi:histidine ammonia-lyase
MTAFQAMEFLRPLRSSAPLERVRADFRRVVKAWDRDRELHPDLERSRVFLESDAMERAISRLA